MLGAKYVFVLEAGPRLFFVVSRAMFFLRPIFGDCYVPKYTTRPGEQQMVNALRLLPTSLLALARFMRVFFFFNTLGERSLAVLQQRGDGEVPGAHGGDDAHGKDGVKRRPRKVKSGVGLPSRVSRFIGEHQLPIPPSPVGGAALVVGFWSNEFVCASHSTSQRLENVVEKYLVAVVLISLLLYAL